MSPVKRLPLCKDCRHLYGPGRFKGLQCRAPERTRFSVVHGHLPQVREPEQARRDSTNDCGLRARWFTPRTSLGAHVRQFLDDHGFLLLYVVYATAIVLAAALGVNH